MAHIPRIIPISDLRREAAATVDLVRDTDEPVYITQRGRAVAVLLNLAEYNKLLDEREYLEIELRSQDEAKAGVFHDAAEVIADMNELIAREE